MHVSWMLECLKSLGTLLTFEILPLQSNILLDFIIHVLQANTKMLPTLFSAQQLSFYFVFTVFTVGFLVISTIGGRVILVKSNLRGSTILNVLLL